MRLKTRKQFNRRALLMQKYILIENLRKQGKSINELAYIFNLSKQRIDQILKGDLGLWITRYKKT